MDLNHLVGLFYHSNLVIRTVSRLIFRKRFKSFEIWLNKYLRVNGFVIIDKARLGKRTPVMQEDLSYLDKYDCTEQDLSEDGGEAETDLAAWRSDEPDLDDFEEDDDL